MQQLVTDNIWAHVKRHARKARRRLAAIAYVSASKYVRFQKGDVLVCDASDGAIRSGETSAFLLNRLQRCGVKLYNRPQLHSKVIALDSVALIGSSNLSDSSAKHLREAGILTSNPDVVSQAKAFIHLVMNEATEMDKTFLAHILGLPVKKRLGKRFVRRKRMRQFGSRLWITRVHEMEPEEYKKEEGQIAEAVEELRKEREDNEFDPNWIRFAGTSRLRREGRPGDRIIELSSTKRGRRITVTAPVTVLLRQDKRKWTRLYFDEDTKGEIIVLVAVQERNQASQGFASEE